MGDIKTYPRQRKEPEMLNDFGPAGGYDCLYPGAPKLGRNNKSNLKGRTEKGQLKERGFGGSDVMNPSEEREE